MNNIVLINNNDFNKIMVAFTFNIKLKEEDVGLLSFIKSMLLKNNIRIKNEEEFDRELIRHNILNTNIFIRNFCENYYLVIYLMLPDPKYYKYDLKETLNFIMYSLYNPYFREEEIKKIKERIKNKIQNISVNIRSYANFKINKIIDDKLINLNLTHHPEKIDIISKEKIKEFFEKNIKDFNPRIYVMGRDVKTYEDILKNLNNKDKKSTKICQNTIKKILFKCDQEIKEKCKFKQSSIDLIYNIKNYTKEDIYLLELLMYLFNSQASNLLLTRLRIENPFVYTTGATINFKRGFFSIKALLYNENINPAINEIKKLLKDMQNEKYIKPYIEKVLIKEELDIISDKDYMSNLFYELIDEDLGIKETYENSYKHLKKLTSKDLKDFINRLELKLTYIIEGETNAK